ncbi:heme exporter protein C [Aggregatibacter actinomycetemcomitans NUM4039]|nr:cytochrome c biogenesis protein [Aggregatibacter actinomycetemcomitans]BAS47255.1 heme exporter protein C [Aggregatibacter actinomycetemcomitans NUM4039]
MWKWLHPYAKSEIQYQLCGKFSSFFAILTALLLVIGIVWGLAFAPADYQQGNSFRIMYVHVPTAIWSMGVYGSMAIAALVALVWQIKQAQLAMITMAPIGRYLRS